MANKTVVVLPKISDRVWQTTDSKVSVENVTKNKETYVLFTQHGTYPLQHNKICNCYECDLTHNKKKWWVRVYIHPIQARLAYQRS